MAEKISCTNLDLQGVPGTGRRQMEGILGSISYARVWREIGEGGVNTYLESWVIPPALNSRITHVNGFSKRQHHELEPESAIE